jgi:hypothetical protein
LMSAAGCNPQTRPRAMLVNSNAMNACSRATKISTNRKAIDPNV